MNKSFGLIIQVEVYLGQFLMQMGRVVWLYSLSLLAFGVGGLLPEESFMQIGKNLVVGKHLDHQHQFVLFFELLEAAVVDLLADHYLLLQLLNAIYKKLL